ncbi:MAG TPA: TOBE domain-containing protein, partial [Candidatus Dormibacteraeota bacterium]|nr:TOBE domain-containing protein [Candidatus Dormibacteraeota bacterium]
LADGGEQGSGWRCRLVGASFLGSTIRYDLEGSDGQRLKVDRLAGTDAVLSPGNEVFVHWDLDSAVVVGGTAQEAVGAEVAE